MLRTNILLYVLTGVLLAILSPVAAQSQIQRYFARGFEGFLLVNESEFDDSVPVAAQTPFAETILEEAAFRAYSNWRVRLPEGAELRLEVYETEFSTGAFFLFHRHGVELEESRRLRLPLGNAFTAREALFWRGNFFFRVLSSRSQGISEAAFTTLVRTVENTIDIENLFPVTVSHLPKESIATGSMRYYLGPASLSENEAFPDPLLAEIESAPQVEISYAQYGPQARLFLIGFPTPSLAEDYSVTFQEELGGFFSEEGIFLKRTGVMLALFLGSAERAQTLLDQVEYEPTIQWLYEKDKDGPSRSETRTFFGLIARAILGTGTFLVMIIGAGLVVGVARYSLLQKFPRLHRRKEMVRLNLE